MPYKDGTWGDKAKARSRTRNEYFVEYHKKHHKKMRARKHVSRALKKGAIVRLPCYVCGTTEGRLNAHHPDYDRPLCVKWLCPEHHREEHKVNPPINGE